MSMLEIIKQDLDERKVFPGSQNPYITKVVNSIVFPDVPERMKKVIAVSQITTFASQFRRNIILWDEITEVPVNAISFVIRGSGGHKDSSIKAARKCFDKGYSLIDTHVKMKVRDDAINKALQAGEENAEDYAVYKEYLKPIPPIDINPTTHSGFVQHINDIGDIGIGSGFLQASEFSDELAHNHDMVDNIKVLSEVYDTGDKAVKYTKSVENRSQAISGQPVSALLVGSPGHILYDESVKKKFNIAFMSKLARRSWFCFAPDKIEEPVFDSTKKFLEYEEKLENEAKQKRIGINEESFSIAKSNLNKINSTITVSPEVEELFKLYRKYNNDLADTFPDSESTHVLIRRHLQWKALKLAGAFTIMNCEDEISEKSYIEAIYFAESLDGDMQQFEKVLNKLPHERLADYLKTKPIDNGSFEINTHELTSKGFMKSASLQKLKEMASLCAGYDKESLYIVINQGTAIQCEPVIKTDVIGVSYKFIDTTNLNKAIESKDIDAIRKEKVIIGRTSIDGFEFHQQTFAKLGNLLKHDTAFSPFKFKGGVRSSENIESGAKWMVFDIDNSPMTAEETHLLLSAYNHHISLTSDPQNYNNYRLLIELDSEIILNKLEWRYFCKFVAEELGLTIDNVPQAQIFYSYEGRKIYSNLDGEPLNTRDLVMSAKEAIENKSKLNTSLSNPQKQALLNDPLITFAYAFEAPYGKGSLNMYKMIKHAIDLGANQTRVLELIDDVNEYWENPMPYQRIENLKQQAIRLF